MPRSDKHFAIARQWEILKRLPSRPPGATARELVDWLDELGFAVTMRTVQRDLDDLAGLFPLEVNECSKPYRWYWLSGCGLDFPGIEIADAVSLAIVERSLKCLVPAALLKVLESKFQQARKKLEAAGDNRYSRWTQRVRYLPPGLELRAPAVDSRSLETVQGALMEEKQIEVRYLRPEDSRAKTFRLHPLAFVQQGPSAYLVATAFDYREPILFALHRIRSAKRIDKPARRPRGFSVDSFIAEGGMQFGDGQPIRLTASVEQELAMRLAETPLSEDQRIRGARAPYRLTATVRDSWQLEFWILSQSERFTVLKPKSLRDRIRQSLQTALENY